MEAAQKFIAALQDMHPDTPGEWFQFALEEPPTHTHVGHVAVFVNGGDPRPAEVGVTL